MKIGRNDTCPCGSGKKYKNCCLNEHAKFIPKSSFPIIKQNILLEKHMNLVPSIIVNGKRIRSVGNRVYYRPLKETFHEFTLFLLLRNFDENWRNQQMQLKERDRHVLLNWVKADYELSKWVLENGIKTIDANGVERYGYVASGESQALGQLAYDVYCLLVINKFPDNMIKRLKDNKAFQGARYEIAVAAIMARAGFDIEFLDYKIKSEKHCEFIASHRETKLQIGVEAKSKHRQGVLNMAGEYNSNSEIRGDIWHLYHKARTQKPEGLPFIIFIDMNIRPTPDIPLLEKPWHKDLIKAVNDYGEATEENPDPFNAIIFTNFCPYYTGQDIMPSGQYDIAISKIPQIKIKDNSILENIIDSVHNYSRIPEEV